MSELGWDTRYCAQDTLKAIGPDGQLMDFANTLDERQPILQDAQFYPANDTLSHTGLREVSLPTPQIIKLGDGHDASKTEITSYREGLSIFKDRIQVPVDVTRISPNPGRERSKREMRHMEGFNQGVANHILNGTSVADPEKFNGLAVRYASTSTTGVYSVGGDSSTLTSVWLIQWGEDTVHMVYPKNHPHLGVNIEDKGQVLVSAENSKDRWDYVTELEWWCGLDIYDQRSVKRVCNIETLIYTAGNLTMTLVKKIIEARNSYRTSGTVWLYCSETVVNALEFLALDKSNVRYSSDNPWGKEMLMLRDMPIRKWDSISDTETTIS